MKKYLVLLLMISVLFSCSKADKKAINIIPKPNQLMSQKGDFSFMKKMSIEYQMKDENFDKSVSVFKQLFYDKTKVKLAVNPQDTYKKTIHLMMNDSLDPEQYTLLVSPEKVVIEGGDQAALFYGLMSLFQMIEADGKYFTIPAVTIKDQPAFKWRGMHLDVARHFYSVQEVKKIIRGMALLKLNMFHWHLTEDQGWRIEIKKYPKLTTISSSRKETLIGHASYWPETYDGKEEKGFYTQDEIKEVVAYAAAHQITIIPEIEMPGHAVAALAAYPEYACTDGPFKVWTKWGVSQEVFCAGNEKTYQFLEDILDEVCELFPGPYIHIGGDECPKSRWEACSACQHKIKEEGLEDVEQLQGYFTTRIEAYLATKGKRAVGWDEILDGGVPPRAVIMSWRGEAGGITAAKAGNDVVMAPSAFVYFDHYQDVLYEPLAIGGLTPIKEVYDYQPIPEEMTVGQEHILGAQAQLWTEYIVGNDHLEYMIFPRLMALAEVLWTDKDLKDYPDFQNRLSYWYANLDVLDMNYRIDYPHGFKQVNKTLDNSFSISLSSDNSKAKIYYTINGFDPDENALLYTKPIVLNMPNDSILKVVAILPNGKRSQVHQGVFTKEKFSEAISNIEVQAGLNYEYVQGEFSSAAVLDSLKIDETKVVEKVTTPPNHAGNFYGVKYEGLIHVPEDALYTFYLNSDDGSVLYIDDQKLIDNDGFHYAYEKSGQTALKKGYHKIKVLYMQAYYGGFVELKWQYHEKPVEQISKDHYYAIKK